MHPALAAACAVPAGDALLFVCWEHQSELASANFPQRLGEGGPAPRPDAVSMTVVPGAHFLLPNWHVKPVAYRTPLPRVQA